VAFAAPASPPDAVVLFGLVEKASAGPPSAALLARAEGSRAAAGLLYLSGPPLESLRPYFFTLASSFGITFTHLPSCIG